MDIGRIYFGVRNNIDLMPVEGKNYNQETIKTMTPRLEADNITRKIVFNIPSTARPVTVFEACGGIGGNSLSFADNPSVQTVYTFESRPEFNKQLSQTVKDYKLTSKIGVGAKFGALPTDFAGAVMFFDVSKIVGDVKVSGYSMEQWLGASPHAALVAILAQPDFVLKPVDGFRYVIENLPKHKLILAISEKGMAAAEKRGVEKYQALALEKLEKQNSLEWFTKFQMYIYNLLGRIIPDPQERMKYVTDEPMKVWAKAFTHESFDRDFNYEQLETLGDRALEFVFSRYLIKSFPDIDSQQITQLKRAYMSKVQQSELARNLLKVTPFIRHLGLNITPSMYEDVFESMFGALFDISDRFIKEGAGYVNAYNMIASIFGEVGIDFALANEPDKSLVHERFSQLGWGQNPRHEVEETPTGIKYKVLLTKPAIEYFERKGIKVDPVIGEGEAYIQMAAENIAYANALKTLNRLGVKVDKLAVEKEKLQSRDKIIQPYLAETNAKLREMGYKSFEFFTSKTASTFGANLVQLYGIPYQGKKKLLLSTLATSEEQGMQNLLKLFTKK